MDCDHGRSGRQRSGDDGENKFGDHMEYKSDCDNLHPVHAAQSSQFLFALCVQLRAHDVPYLQNQVQCGLKSILVRSVL